jgi:hypothetical protein
VAFALLAMAANSPRVGRGLIASMEKSLDERISRLWPDNPLSILGSTRGIYLEKYGAVFTAEVNMVPQPLTLMNPILTPADKANFQKKKKERLPQLRKELVKALADTAASLDPVPVNEQVVIAVYLTHMQEDPPGIPAQITVQGERGKLIDAAKAGGVNLDAVVKVWEN